MVNFASMKKINLYKIGFAFLLFISTAATSQKIKITYWQASLHRVDGNDIPFNFKLEEQNKKTVLYIINDAEKIKVENILFTKDSVFIKMPVFESSFKAKIANGEWEGVWTKGTAASDQVLPFSAHKRTYAVLQKTVNQIAG